MATANVRIVNEGTDPTASFTECRLRFRAGAGAWVAPTVGGDRVSGTWIPPASTSPAYTAITTLPVAAAFDAAPGNYDVQVQCRWDLPDPRADGAVEAITLMVVAAAH